MCPVPTINMNRCFYGLLILAFGLTLWISTSSGSLQCKDENGDPVDWSIVYKIPKEAKTYQSDGLESVYMTSNGESSWVTSKFLLNDERHLIGSTLSPLYTPASMANYIIYSDQPPHGETVGYGGHSKGVLAFDASTGFWLVHSVPQFPVDPKVSGYSYPSTGQVNGQTFLCISFKTQLLLTDIVEQLLYIRPHVYGQSIVDTVLKQSPHLADLLKKRWIKQASSEKTLISLGGQSLTSFGKSPDAHIDIYSQLAAQSLKIDLLAETWRKGAGGPLPSECGLTYQVVNVDQMSINYRQTSAIWNYMEDHSKWAISGQSSEPFVCIGDVNRMASQAKRGGGLVCLKNKNVWQSLYSSIKQFEPCPRSKRRSDQSFVSRIFNFFTSIFTSKFSLPARTMTRDRSKKELR